MHVNLVKRPLETRVENIKGKRQILNQCSKFTKASLLNLTWDVETESQTADMGMYKAAAAAAAAS